MNSKRRFQQGAIQIAQPDLGACGGITAAQENCRAGGGVLCGYSSHHVWGGPIIQIAAIQIDTYIPNFLIQESIYKRADFIPNCLMSRSTGETATSIPATGPSRAQSGESKLIKYKA
jgi:L-alanine-DL-glutamate epimerase-like enolase superfamily enzyme